MAEAPQAVVGAAALEPADAEAAEKQIEQWKIKKLIKSLEQARGCVGILHLSTSRSHGRL